MKYRVFRFMPSPMAVLLLLGLFGSAGMAAAGGEGLDGRQWLDDEQTVELKAAGEGWSRVEIFDEADAARSAGAEHMIIWRKGLRTVPLSAEDRARVELEFFDEDTGSGYDDIYAYNAGSGMREFDFAVVNTANLAAVRGVRGLCSKSIKEVRETFDFNEGIPTRTWNFSSGAFEGSFEASLPIQGQAELYAKLRIKKCLGIPVGWKMRETIVQGTVTLDGGAGLAGEVDYTWNYEREYKVLSKRLGKVTVSGIPIKFRLHGFVGFSLEARLRAMLEASVDLDGSGSFYYRCHHEEGCSGTSDFGSFSNSQLNGGVEIDAEGRAWGRLMVRAEVISSSIAYVEAGVKGWAGGDLWGYYGNTCGDADGDGDNETVGGLAADLKAGYDVLAKADTLFTSSREWTLASDEWHLGWYSLISDRSVFTPMVLGLGHLEPNEVRSFTVRMRPCYPYKDAVTIQPPPGFGAAQTIDDPKNDTVEISGSFATGPTAVLRVDVPHDAVGRELETYTTRSIIVADRQDPAIITAQPMATTVDEGSMTQLSVQAEGDAPLEFRWQKDGVDLLDGGHYSGTDTSILSISNAAPAIIGHYRVRVTNPYATVQSQSAYVTLTPECQLTQLTGHDGILEPPRVEWATTCVPSDNTYVMVKTSTVPPVASGCELDAAFWHSGYSGDRPADYMTGGYFGGCPSVPEADFWVELRDERDDRLVFQSSPVRVSYMQPEQLCRITAFHVTDNGPGEVPDIVWASDCDLVEPRIELQLKASTLSETPAGCELDRSTQYYLFEAGTLPLFFIEGGYGNNCPAIEHASVWLELVQDGVLVQRTDYHDVYYQP